MHVSGQVQRTQALCRPGYHPICVPISSAMDALRPAIHDPETIMPRAVGRLTFRSQCDEARESEEGGRNAGAKQDWRNRLAAQYPTRPSNRNERYLGAINNDS
jgi:hypothetical protein